MHLDSWENIFWEVSPSAGVPSVYFQGTKPFSSLVLGYFSQMRVSYQVAQTRAVLGMTKIKLQVLREGYTKGRCLLGLDMFLAGWHLGRDYSFGFKCLTRISILLQVCTFFIGAGPCRSRLRQLVTVSAGEAHRLKALILSAECKFSRL